MSDPTDPNRNPKRDFFVGLTVFVSLIVLAVLIVSFAGIKGWVTRGYQVRVLLPRAQGLTSGSTVSLAGVPIGTVTSVAVAANKDGSYGVSAMVDIDKSVTLPDTARVELNEQILGGVSRIIFFADKPGRSLPTDGSAVVSGYRSNLAIEMADNINGTLDGTVGPFMQDTHDLVASLKKTTDLIGGNFEPVDPEKIAKGEAQPNIQTLIVRMNGLVAHTDDVVADPRMREDLRATLAATKEAAANANIAIKSANGTISELGRKIGTAVDSTSGDANKTMLQMRETLGVMQAKYGKLADELNKTAAGVNALLDAVNKGEGTAGKLVHDPELYENMNDAAKRLDKAFEEVRLLVEKFKREGVDLKIK